MRICRIFHFDSAHFLPDYRGKCEKMHGHTYRLEVVIEGKVGEGGMVMDFCRLTEVVGADVLEELDHRNLNELMDNPTAERIVEWIWKRLQKRLPLHSIRLWEGDGKWVEKQSA